MYLFTQSQHGFPAQILLVAFDFVQSTNSSFTF